MVACLSKHAKDDENFSRIEMTHMATSMATNINLPFARSHIIRLARDHLRCTGLPHRQRNLKQNGNLERSLILAEAVPYLVEAYQRKLRAMSAALHTIAQHTMKRLTSKKLNLVKRGKRLPPGCTHERKEIALVMHTLGVRSFSS